MKRKYNQDLKENTGDFRYVPDDIIKKLVVILFTNQPHTKDSLIALDSLRLTTKWLEQFIHNNKEFIYKESLLPIEHAALVGQLERFAFEKVFNKAQLYGTFLCHSDYKTIILPNCVMHEKVKELLIFSSNAICSSLNNRQHNTHFMPVYTGHKKNTDSTYTLVASIRDETIPLINELSNKPHTLTNEQLDILNKTYNTNTIVDALKNLYGDFMLTINAEDFLHFLFDIKQEIPSDLFKDLAHIRGNINAHDTNGKTFIEKAGKNPMYEHLVPELLSLLELTNYPSSSHALLFNT